MVLSLMVGLELDLFSWNQEFFDLIDLVTFC